MTPLCEAIIFSMALGQLSVGVLILCLVELKERDPNLQHWHEPL